MNTNTNTILVVAPSGIDRTVAQEQLAAHRVQVVDSYQAGIEGLLLYNMQKTRPDVLLLDSSIVSPTTDCFYGLSKENLSRNLENPGSGVNLPFVAALLGVPYVGVIGEGSTFNGLFTKRNVSIDKIETTLAKTTQVTWYSPLRMPLVFAIDLTCHSLDEIHYTLERPPLDTMRNLALFAAWKGHRDAPVSQGEVYASQGAYVRGEGGYVITKNWKHVLEDLTRERT